MNVFILCTGRSGSTSFVNACKYIENYTSAHESRIHKLGLDRLDYADQHIEGDNRLSWILGGLDHKYGKKAFYVHLKRDRNDTAHSYNRRWINPGSIMRAFVAGIKAIKYFNESKSQRLKYCLDYYDCVNENIVHFLKDKPLQMTIQLDQVEEGFRELWREISATGDLEIAVQSFKKRSNRSVDSQTKSRWKAMKLILIIAFDEIRYLFKN